MPVVSLPHATGKFTYGTGLFAHTIQATWEWQLHDIFMLRQGLVAMDSDLRLQNVSSFQSRLFCVQSQISVGDIFFHRALQCI
jgi:hypothetical protein